MSSADRKGKVVQYVLAILKLSWPDYATIICLGLLLMVFRENVDGNRRPFTPGIIEDSAFPYNTTDTVPSWTLQSIVWILPIGTMLGAAVLHALTPLQAHQHILNFMITYIFTGVLTNAVKLQIGRPRPSFLARCFPDTNATEALSSFEPLPFSSVSSAVCTNPDEAEIENAYKSFPSGHASYSASAGMYLTLFLVHVLRVFSGAAPAVSAVVALVPVCMGVWVGLTRISDFEHHFTDVLAGSLLGMAVASIFFFQAHAMKRDAQVLATDPMSPPVARPPAGHSAAAGEAVGSDRGSLSAGAMEAPLVSGSGHS